MGNTSSGCRAHYYKENDDDSDDDCIPIPVKCDVNKYRLTANGPCLPIPEDGCPVNEYKTSITGECKKVKVACDVNQYKTEEDGPCKDVPKLCGAGKYLDGDTCVDIPKSCGPGKYLNLDECVDLPNECKKNQYKNSLDECIPIPKVNAIDMISNNEGKKIVDSLDRIVKCDVHKTTDKDKGIPLGGGWCANNYNYFLPAGMLPTCRGGKAQRICYEPGNTDEDYYLAIKGLDEKNKCSATTWKRINSEDNAGLINSKCKAVIDLMNIDKKSLPKKIDGKTIGGRCANDGDCHSRNCSRNDNKCIKGVLDLKKMCQHNDQCISLNCSKVSSKCIPGVKLKGEKCTSATECSTGKCSLGKCISKTVQGFSNNSGNMDVYGNTQPMDTLILAFVILMVLFLLFRICKRLKVMK